MPGETFGNELNLFATMLAGLLAGFVLLKRRRAKRSHRPMPVFVVGSASTPNAPTHDFEQVPTPRPQPVTPKVAKVVEPKTTLRVDVLGPLTISPVNVPPSDPVRAIVAYLAINTERPFTLDEIQTAIWPLTDAGTDIKKPAMRNYMVDARKIVGARHLPSASGRAGYQLCDFTTDWSEFQALLSQATKASKDRPGRLRRRALDLAKGPPVHRRHVALLHVDLDFVRGVQDDRSVTTLAHELGTTSAERRSYSPSRCFVKACESDPVSDLVGGPHRRALGVDRSESDGTALEGRQSGVACHGRRTAFATRITVNGFIAGP